MMSLRYCHRALAGIRTAAARRSLATATSSVPSAECLRLEAEYAAHNYHPIPVVFAKASGVDVWDPEGRHYFDFLSAYSAVNQGHCHPRIINALTRQAQQLTLSSRAFYNDKLGLFARYLHDYFDQHYDMVLPANGGAEAVETALKLARKWAYQKKKVPENEALIVCCTENFHGRTIAIVSMSTDPDCRREFGPFLPGIIQVPYNDPAALKRVFEQHGPKIAGFLVEPIQGEAGVKVPNSGYLKTCFDLCVQHNVLFIADEIQTGLARTGKMLACDWEGLRPHVLILGKALSGGVYPVSAVLADKDIMMCIRPGEHGSTYGGNPMACAVAMEALQVIKDENLVERAQVLGEKFRALLKQIDSPLVATVRGKGLLNAIDIIGPQQFEQKTGKSMKLPTAWDICMRFKDNGLLAKPTHDSIIRLAPPLVISDKQLDECTSIIEKSLKQVTPAGL